MESTGINKITCPLFTITLSKALKKVQINNEDFLGIDYMRTKTTIAPDKILIKKDLEAGRIVDGAELVDSERRLMIK